ncbi:helix-turn-helix domain-containing protein [Streptosporangium algeriense]|uniref:Helix-turn-helix domain-containing protein n=1 Tax=Streptosporangium algeriense TaxID=1682748 RepID=A0ABW3DL40_9ACTN
MTTPQMPEPPPEAVLIRRVRKAKRESLETIAQAAGLSTARLSQIERGYETKQGQVIPVIAPPGTLAHIWVALKIAPDRLEEVGRADAREYLDEIHTAQPPANPESKKDWREKILEIDDLTETEKRAVVTLIQAMRSVPQDSQAQRRGWDHRANRAG